jgi:hypothetical protein
MKTIKLTPRLLAILAEAVKAEAENIACVEKEDRPVPLDSVERVLVALADSSDGAVSVNDGDLFTLQGCWEVGSEFCHEVGAVEADETDAECTVLFDCTDAEWQQISDAIGCRAQTGWLYRA